MRFSYKRVNFSQVTTYPSPILPNYELTVFLILGLNNGGHPWPCHLQSRSHDLHADQFSWRLSEIMLLTRMGRGEKGGGKWEEGVREDSIPLIDLYVATV